MVITLQCAHIRKGASIMREERFWVDDAGRNQLAANLCLNPHYTTTRYVDAALGAPKDMEEFARLKHSSSVVQDAMRYGIEVYPEP